MFYLPQSGPAPSTIRSTTRSIPAGRHRLLHALERFGEEIHGLPVLANGGQIQRLAPASRALESHLPDPAQRPPRAAASHAASRAAPRRATSTQAGQTRRWRCAARHLPRDAAWTVTAGLERTEGGTPKIAARSGRNKEPTVGGEPRPGQSTNHRCRCDTANRQRQEGTRPAQGFRAAPTSRR